MPSLHRALPTLALASLCLPLVGCLTQDADLPTDERVGDIESDDDAEAIAIAHVERLRPELLAEGEQLHPQRAWVDELGMSHARMHQSVDGIPVFGAEAIVHSRADGTFDGMTDGLHHDIDVSTTPWLSESWAIEQAIAATGGRTRLTEEPTAALTILRHGERDHLAFQVELRQMQPGFDPAQPVVFIDAHDGEEIWRYDALSHIALDHSYRTTWDMNNSTKFGGAVVGDSSDSVLAETHASLGAVVKFLVVVVGRDSYDDAGAQVNAYGHYGNNYMNAFWDAGAERLVLGDGDGVLLSHMGKRDIVSHEVAHAIVNYEAGLIAANQSGALAETTGDILAARVADYSNADWVFDIGEDCWLPLDPTVALRYMGHPSDDGSSRDHYSDRYQGPADNGGVHFNSGIGNHFFYLLSEGGQHHDPAFRSGLVVNGIGIEDAFDVWYRALTVYMVPSTGFIGARAATEQAADDLFGPVVADEVATAWYEVGVGKMP